ncbi:MAG: hypothetical protein ACTHNP_03485 [Solirubrobacterales bacterium]
MRLVRTFVLAGAALAAACAIAPGTTLAAPAPCPTELNALELRAPTYGRASQSFAAEVVTIQSAPVTEVILIASYKEGDAESSVTLTGAETTVVIPTPAVDPKFKLTLQWKQGEGTAAACEGTIAYAIPVIPAYATAGTPLVPRLFGRFKVFEREVTPPRHEVFKLVWSFQPQCQYFACATAVKSSAHLRGTFHPLGNGGYELETRYPPSDSCVHRKPHRLILRRAYRETVRVRLRVKKDPLVNEVESFTGAIHIHWEATPRAQAKGCSRNGGYALQRVRGLRIQA